jgi:hypothetical protein
MSEMKLLESKSGQFRDGSGGRDSYDFLDPIGFCVSVVPLCTRCIVSDLDPDLMIMHTFDAFAQGKAHRGNSHGIRFVIG